MLIYGICTILFESQCNVRLTVGSVFYSAKRCVWMYTTSAYVHTYSSAVTAQQLFWIDDGGICCKARMEFARCKAPSYVKLVTQWGVTKIIFSWCIYA